MTAPQPPQTLVWACYEAGPTGHDRHRLLVLLGVHCALVDTDRPNREGMVIAASSGLISP